MSKILNGLLIFVLLVGIAWVGKDLLIPLVFGFLLWVVITSWQQFFNKLHINRKKLPKWLQQVLSVSSIFVIIIVLADLLSRDLSSFSQVYPQITAQAASYADSIESVTGFNLNSLWQEYIPTLNISGFAASTASGLSNIFGTAFTAVLYLIYIFGEQKWFAKKLKATSSKTYDHQLKLSRDILQSIKQYVGIKTGTSFLTAALSYLVMVIIGLEFAFVWAFIIFVMNFIPSIGSAIATGFPVIFAIISTGTIWQPVTALLLIGFVQLYIGNSLEPKYMSNKLNISSLLVIFALYFWGALWGIAGMFLAVPLTVIIMIILSRIPQTRNIGIWMSGDGDV